MWMRDNEPNLKRTYQFVTPKDYVIYKFTDVLATDFSSAGNIGGIFDIHKKTWSPEMCDILGIPLSLFPERITSSFDIVGRLNKHYAEATGLLEGTPVVAGGIDAPVAQFSCGVINEGEHVAMTGTSICWGTVHNGKYLSPGLISFPYVVNDDTSIYTFGGGATSGAVIRWFRDEFGAKEKEEERKTGISAYSLLEQKARNVKPGSGGLLVLPYFMGERSPIWNPDARGSILGLFSSTPENISTAPVWRAWPTLRQYGGSRQSGNLARRCMLHGGRPFQKRPVDTDFRRCTGFYDETSRSGCEAPFGDAPSRGLEQESSKIPGDQILVWFPEQTIPDQKNHEIYSRYFELYKKLYTQSKEIMTELAKMQASGV